METMEGTLHVDGIPTGEASDGGDDFDEVVARRVEGRWWHR